MCFCTVLNCLGLKPQCLRFGLGLTANYESVTTGYDLWSEVGQRELILDTYDTIVLYNLILITLS